MPGRNFRSLLLLCCATWTEPLSIHAQIEFESLRVGVAQTEMVFPEGLNMWGYTPRKNEGKLDPLMARVFVFDSGPTRVALVTLDLGRTFNSESMDRVRRRVAELAGVDHVIFTASHTHSGPYLLDEYPNGKTPDWELSVLDTIAEAIEEAAGSTFQAKLAIAHGSARIGHNRRFIRNDGTVKMLWTNPTKISTYPVDPEVTIVRIDDMTGEPRGVLVGYACHPVVFGPDNLEYSADFPGAMARLVADRLKGDPVVAFIQGGCGDINPYMDKRRLEEGAVALKDRVGAELGNEVVRAIGNVASETPAHPSVKVVTETITFRSRRRPESQTFDAVLTVMTLNDRICFVGLPGEPFVEFQMELKRRAGMQAAFFMGYTNGYLRYFPTIRAAVEGGYGADTQVSIVEVGAGERLMLRAYNHLYRMTGRLSDQPSR